VFKCFKISKTTSSSISEDDLHLNNILKVVFYVRRKIEVVFDVEFEVERKQHLE